MLPGMVNGCYLLSMISKLTEAECRTAMGGGEFARELVSSAPAVALVLTQSWCPQWRFMQAYLKDAAEQAEGSASIFYLEYDREPFYRDFMAFKEDVFGNYEIPYIRYYRGGKLHAESNFISKQGFLSRLGVD